MTTASPAPAAAPSWRVGRRLWIILIALAIIVGAWLRLHGLMNSREHKDEVIARTLTRDAVVDGVWNMSWDRSSMPEIFRGPQHNFSSYHLFVSALEALAQHGCDAESLESGRLLRLRFYSVVFGTGLVLLAAVLAWSLAGSMAGVVGAWLVALNPLLVQDSLYARADAFCALLVSGGLASSIFALHTEHATRRRVGLFASGLLLGLGGACKISVLPLATMPGLVVVLLWARRPREFLGLLSWAVSGAVLGLVAGAPGLLTDWSGYWAGVSALRAQYGTPSPVVSNLDGSASANLVFAYFMATVGPGLLLLPALGVLTAWKKGLAREGLLLLIPAVGAALLFLGKPLFFERNYSHAIAPLLVAGALGFLPGSWRWRGALALLAFSMPAVSLPTLNGLRAALDGRAAVELLKLRERIEQQHHGRPVVYSWVTAPSKREYVVSQVDTNDTGVILGVLGANDEWTEAGLNALNGVLRLEKLETYEGPFAHLPACTLFIYHQPVVHFYLATKAQRDGGGKRMD